MSFSLRCFKFMSKFVLTVVSPVNSCSATYLYILELPVYIFFTTQHHNEVIEFTQQVKHNNSVISLLHNSSTTISMCYNIIDIYLMTLISLLVCSSFCISFHINMNDPPLDSCFLVLHVIIHSLVHMLVLLHDQVFFIFLVPPLVHVLV